MHKTKQGHLISREGRQCSKCGQFKAWLKENGRPNFWRHPARASGFDNQCVECRNSSKYKQHRKSTRKPKAYVTCVRCGDEMEPSSAVLCDTCGARGGAWSNSALYLMVANTHPFNRGGHFLAPEFKATLKLGYFPNGMVVEHWMKREYKGTFAVSGTELVPLNASPRGDGLYLVPTQDGKPIKMPTPFRESA